MASQGGNIRYVINSSGKLVEITGPWDEFYAGNSEEALNSSKVLGTNIFDCMADSTTSYVYENFHKQLLDGKVEQINFGCRCDSTNLSRSTEIKLKLVPGTNNIAYESKITKVRFMHNLKELPEEFADAAILMCSICKSFRLESEPKGWTPVEDNFEIMLVHDNVSHTVCPGCLEDFSRRGYLE